jgi:hypothetical protein
MGHRLADEVLLELAFRVKAASNQALSRAGQSLFVLGSRLHRRIHWILWAQNSIFNLWRPAMQSSKRSAEDHRLQHKIPPPCHRTHAEGAIEL